MKLCDHFEKRSAAAWDGGGQSKAKTNPTSCNSGLYSQVNPGQLLAMSIPFKEMKMER